MSVVQARIGYCNTSRGGLIAQKSAVSVVQARIGYCNWVSFYHFSRSLQVSVVQARIGYCNITATGQKQMEEFGVSRSGANRLLQHSIAAMSGHADQCQSFRRESATATGRNQRRRRYATGVSRSGANRLLQPPPGFRRLIRLKVSVVQARIGYCNCHGHRPVVAEVKCQSFRRESATATAYSFCKTRLKSTCQSFRRESATATGMPG